MKHTMIRIGQFFFKYRNIIFPLVIVLLFLTAAPPATLFGSRDLEYVKDICAVFFILLGLLTRALVIGYAYIKRGGLDKKVFADTLVTEGFFKICRNPLYLGNMLIYAGLFLAHGNPFVVVTGIVFFLFIYYCIIFTEEDYLANKFGTSYQVYCQTVPRWIPLLNRFDEAKSGMVFNVARVIIKDYTTIFNTIIVLCVVEIYKEIVAGLAGQEKTYSLVLGMIIAVCVIGTIAVKQLKKRRILTDNKVLA